MARRTKRAALVVTEEQSSMLKYLAGSRTVAQREVERAKMLAYAEGKSPTEIHCLLGLSRPTIYKCIDKALAAGVNAGLRDRYHRPHATPWQHRQSGEVTDLSCRQPKELGLAAELWTLSALTARARL